MPTFVIEIVFVVESLVKNQCKDKSLELSLMHDLPILCFVHHGL